MSMSAPAALPALTTPLEPMVEARIAALPTNDRMRYALRLVADGWTYRDAAKTVGYASQKDLYGWAKRAGLAEIHTDRLAASLRRVAHPSTQELERRLEEAPEEISTKDLAVVAGITTDKLARYEGLGAAVDAEAMRARSEQIAEVLERLIQSGGAKVSISVEPAEGAERQRKPGGDVGG